MVNSFSAKNSITEAVLFLVFNRIETTKEVFECIRQAKPKRLYVAADGPRINKEGEAEKVQTVREFIIKGIDWECEVHTLFRDKNLGCKYAVSSAISWFFKNEDQGIILEDDCKPNLDFFRFCEEMLSRYKESKDIGIISGTNHFISNSSIKEDYYFSIFPFIWGWASWRRVWEYYDLEMEDYDNFSTRESLKNKFLTSGALNYWHDCFKKTSNKQINTWDYQFTYSLIKNNFLNIIPKVNLISNIGFGELATHTVNPKEAKHSNLPTNRLSFPLIHPQLIKRNYTEDHRFEKQAFNHNSLYNFLKALKLKYF